MQNEWPTQQHDMQIATDIIDKYTELNDGEPLGFLEVVMSDQTEGGIQIKTQKWIIDILVYFCNQYGREQGQAIAGKVLTKVLLKNETIH
jgi:hypothetical protein